MTDLLNLFLAVAQGVAHGDPHLLRNQINTSNHFGNGVLYLNTGIHFQEVVIAIRGENKLDGTGTGVIGCLGDTHG